LGSLCAASWVRAGRGSAVDPLEISVRLPDPHPPTHIQGLGKCAAVGRMIRRDAVGSFVRRGEERTHGGW